MFYRKPIGKFSFFFLHLSKHVESGYLLSSSCFKDTKLKRFGRNRVQFTLLLSLFFLGLLIWRPSMKYLYITCDYTHVNKHIRITHRILCYVLSWYISCTTVKLQLNPTSGFYVKEWQIYIPSIHPFHLIIL